MPFECTDCADALAEAALAAKEKPRMTESDWESIAKERLDAIVQFKARAEAAEARVRELAEQLEEERHRLQRLTTNPRFLGVRNPLGL